MWRFPRNCLLTLISVLLIGSLPPFASAAQKKKEKEKEEDPLAPPGLALLQEKLKSYAPFDEAKLKTEAEAKYKLVKVGDEVTVKHRKGQLTGVLRSIDKKGIQIGDKSVFFIDMDEKELARFSEEKTKDLRTTYLKAQQEAYEEELKSFAEKSRKELLEKYPALGKKKLTELFARLKDRSQADSLASEFAEAYDKSLPLAAAKAEQVAKVAKDFVSLKRGLIFDGKCFRTLAEVEEEKQQAEAEAQRVDELRKVAEQRSKDRSLLPKTASPVFKPDGGLFSSGLKLEITCSTLGAEIKYTTDGKDPTEDSPAYSEPIALSSPRTPVKAKAFHPEFNDSEISISSLFEEQGSGLSASYFSKINGTGKSVTKTDKKISFQWKLKESPDPLIPGECYSIIWTGSIVPKYSETYKFSITVDDGTRLWIGDALLIDQWAEQVGTFTTDVKLTAGMKYDIKLAMCDCLGPGMINFEWSSPSTPKEVVPQNALFPDGKYTDQLQKWNATDKTGSYVNRASMANPLSNGTFTIPKSTQRKNTKKDFKVEL